MSPFYLSRCRSVREFEHKKGQLWAKQIVIDYWKRVDEGWLLAPLLKTSQSSPRRTPPLAASAAPITSRLVCR